MGKVYRFNYHKRRPRPDRTLKLATTGIALGAAVVLGALQLSSAITARSASSAGLGVGCVNPTTVDGDTLRCGSLRIRLASIDAPELPGHCERGRACTPGDANASMANLHALIGGGAVQCRQTDTDRYGRAVALCNVQGRDLSCAQVRGGFAVERYGKLSC